jgi:hypothetical protein
MPSLRTVAAFGYIGCATLAGFALQNYLVTLIATSYIHYCFYIYTYYTRWPKGDRTKYEDFMLIVFSFKCFALAQLAFVGISIVFDSPPYTIPSSFELAPTFSALGLLVTVSLAAYGYYVSAMATNALGIEGTYFGIELGFVKAQYEFVQVWPYNTYPHPMITGQVAAMAVLHVGVFGEQYPWLLPIHCILYLTHMVQEIYDFWAGPPWFANKKK